MVSQLVLSWASDLAQSWLFLLFHSLSAPGLSPWSSSLLYALFLVISPSLVNVISMPIHLKFTCASTHSPWALHLHILSCPLDLSIRIPDNLLKPNFSSSSLSCSTHSFFIQVGDSFTLVQPPKLKIMFDSSLFSNLIPRPSTILLAQSSRSM